MFFSPSLFSTFYPSLFILKTLHLSLSHVHTISVFLSHVNPLLNFTLTTPYSLLAPLIHYFFSPIHSLLLFLSPFSPPSLTLLTLFPHPSHPLPSSFLPPSLSSGMFNTNADRATVFTRGFPVGFHIGNSKRSSKHYLYNHIRIILQYHDDKVATTQGTGTATGTGTGTESTSTKVCVLDQFTTLIC